MSDQPPSRPLTPADTCALLRQTPPVLHALLGPLTAPEWQADEGPGTWNCLAVVRHLVWCEVDDWMPRLRMVQEHGTTRAFRPFDREEGDRRYAGWTPGHLVEEFARLRRANVDALSALALSPVDLAAEGRHPELGVVTLGQLLATWVTHDAAHLAQIARILTHARGRHVGPWRAYFSLLRDRDG